MIPLRSTGSRSGFTVIELLLVVAIIGLLAAVSLGFLGVSRAQSRDAKRVSDVQVIRAGLEQYWFRNAAFPSESPAVALGSGSYAVLTSNGFQASPGTGVFFINVPVGPGSGEAYLYASTISTGYALAFTLERPSVFGPPGTYYAHADGTTDADPTSK